MVEEVPSWELMFRSVWQSCRAQSRNCRGGTPRRKEEKTRGRHGKKETARKEKGRREKAAEMRERSAKKVEHKGRGEGRGRGEEMARWSLSVGTRD